MLLLLAAPASLASETTGPAYLTITFDRATYKPGGTALATVRIHNYPAGPASVTAAGKDARLFTLVFPVLPTAPNVINACVDFGPVTGLDSDASCCWTPRMTPSTTRAVWMARLRSGWAERSRGA